MKVIAIQTTAITYELSDTESAKVKQVAKDCKMSLTSAVENLQTDGEIELDRVLDEMDTDEIIVSVLED